MNLKLLTLAFAIAVAAGANAAESAQPTVGTTIKLEGTLHVKGSLPMTRVVLVRDDDTEWELQKVPADIASVLQNKTVSVEGAVLRPSRKGILLPSLRVDKLGQVTK